MTPTAAAGDNDDDAARQRRSESRAALGSGVLLNIAAAVLLITASAVTRVGAYPTGAPDNACSSMMPMHYAAPQTSSPPYSITTSANTYTAGQRLTVTVNSTAAGSVRNFKGILLECRLTNNALIGKFSSSQNFNLACSDQAVTHSNNDVKQTATFTWIAPSTVGQGNVTFVATVVANFTTFWVNVRSVVVQDNSSPLTTVSPAISTSTFKTMTPSSLTSIEIRSSAAASSAVPSRLTSNAETHYPTAVSSTVTSSQMENADNRSSTIAPSSATTSRLMTNIDTRSSAVASSAVSSSQMTTVESLSQATASATVSTHLMENAETSSSQIITSPTATYWLMTSAETRSSAAVSSLVSSSQVTNVETSSSAAALSTVSSDPTMTNVETHSSTIVSSSATSRLITNIDTSSCNLSKSCFRQPEQCMAGSCDYLLTWTYNDNRQAIDFELEAAVVSADSWVAFGLSTDQNMGADSVVDCVYNDQTSGVDVRMSWNDESRNNRLLNNDQLGLVSGSTSGSYVNGRIVCRFTRLISVTNRHGRRKRQDSTDTVYPLDNATYYILIAKGLARGPASAGYKEYHYSARILSTTPVNFTDTPHVIPPAPVSPLSLNLIKAHGILMVLAWLVFASFGMLMPRYCKMAWPDTKWCGKAVWFQIHQPCMIITLFMTAAGFIIIFIEAKQYVYLPSPTVAHPPLGIIVMALVLINPIMAIFRCEPNDTNRPIFNIFHFVVGLLAHLTAVVTVFLGLYMIQLDLPLWPKGVMAAFICYHALTEIILAINLHWNKLCKRKTAKFEVIQLEEPHRTSVTPTNSSSTFKTVVLAFHLCVVLGCAIAISVQIGLS